MPQAGYELWYADESECHLHPYLARCWMKKGRQLKVQSPGKNRKVVFGAWCFGRGLFVHHTQPRKTAWGVRRLIDRLRIRARHTGRKIVLVMDQGNPHHAKAVHRDLELAAPWIEVFWLPHYSPELNLIERLWKHIKGSRLANVLFRSFPAFQRHVEHTLADFATHPDLTMPVIAEPVLPRSAGIRRKLVAVT